MHYIRIAISVAIGVSIGLYLHDDGDEFWDEVKRLSKLLFGLGGILRKWILALAIILGVIYLCYRLLKLVNWDAVGELAWAIGMFIGIAIVINLPFCLLIWISDKTKKKKG